MFFAIASDASCAQSMVWVYGNWSMMSIEGDFSCISVWNVKHELWLTDTATTDSAIFNRKLLGCMDGIFQSIGKNRWKLGGIDG